MDDPVERALGHAWADDAPWELLTHLTELPNRLGGHSGERRGAEYVAEAFAEAGLADVAIEPFEMTRWTRGSTTLIVETGGDSERTFEAVALPYSPSCDLTGRLVGVGHGTPAEIDDRDVEGAVVVASTGTPPTEGRRVHRMEKAGHAAQAGAAAFVFANHRPGQLPPTGSLRFGERVAIPGVGVSKETGAWLGEYADRGYRAGLTVEATTEPAESQNVRGRLGPDTDEAVLVLAHYDAHDLGEGALDNGCGVATLLGAVRTLRDLDLGCAIEVAATGCEEVGLLGSEALAGNIDTGRLRAVVNVDGAGRFRNLQALAHASGDVAGVVAAVTGRVGHPVDVGTRPHAYSDHWPFLRAGVPALQFHSERPGDEGHWERGWTHTGADTREKADPRTIREHAMLIALVIRELTRADVSVAIEDVRAGLERAGAESGMRAAGIWPDGWD
jgi:Zn-dependent M28 family amino/carboxypeptidase